MTSSRLALLRLKLEKATPPPAEAAEPEPEQCRACKGYGDRVGEDEVVRACGVCGGTGTAS